MNVLGFRGTQPIARPVYATCPLRTRPSRSIIQPCQSSAVAEEFLATAQEQLESNNMIGALRAWEKALKSNSLDDDKRRVILYNCICVHAGMGDLELAQVRHRG
jgi:hypothetical protein